MLQTWRPLGPGRQARHLQQQGLNFPFSGQPRAAATAYLLILAAAAQIWPTTQKRLLVPSTGSFVSPWHVNEALSVQMRKTAF